MRAWECWAALAAWSGRAAYPYEDMEATWKNVLLNQFHDILPGSSIPRVYTDALALYAEFADHLSGCNPCQLVVDNIRKTIQLFKAGTPYPMPAAFQARFREAIKAKWKAKFPHAAV